MSASKPRIQCPLCDSTNVEIRHDHCVKYRYLKKDLVLEGQEHTVCRDCECSFFADGQIERNNKRFIAFEKSVVKDISPREIRELREKYMLSQEQAQKIFNCRGANCFSKWERGEVAPTGTAATLLLLALEDASIMQKLADKAGERIECPRPMRPITETRRSTRPTQSPYYVQSITTRRHLTNKDHPTQEPITANSGPWWANGLSFELRANSAAESIFRKLLTLEPALIESPDNDDLAMFWRGSNTDAFIQKNEIITAVKAGKK